MKTIAYTALHYGAPFLSSAIKSVLYAVDEYHVLYSPHGSHGTQTDAVCPDTRGDLLSIAMEAAGGKLRWHDGNWRHEGQQRDAIYEYTDADLILTLDADEIWRPDQLAIMLETAASGSVRETAAYEMPFWRSFYQAMPDKLCAPARVVNTHHKSGIAYPDVFFAHFGYAQPTRYIEYKMAIHGHRADWRSEWFVDKWLANASEDVHPTNRDFWTARAVNPLLYLPAWMTEHPYAGMGVIE